MRILVYYVAVGAPYYDLCTLSASSLRTSSFKGDIRILSDRQFDKDVVLIPEGERRKPKELKARALPYLPFSNYDYALFADCDTLFQGDPSESIRQLDGKIGAQLSRFRVNTYSAYLTTEERRLHSNIFSFCSGLVAFPCNEDGFYFSKLWNQYMLRLHADRDQLVFTLVWLRHFFDMVVPIKGAAYGPNKEAVITHFPGQPFERIRDEYAKIVQSRRDATDRGGSCQEPTEGVLPHG